jgi:hypothetical protein
MHAAVVSLHLYPVKSLRGFAVDEAVVTRRGLRYDRRFMVVDSVGQFRTLRDHPAMAAVKTAIDGSDLTMSNVFGDTVRVPLEPPTGEPMQVRVWSSTLSAHRVSAAADALLSDILGETLHLVYMPESTERRVKEGDCQAEDIVSFADGYPLLLASTSSLAELNRRIAAGGRAPVPMDRFRANLVVDCAEPFFEDRLGSLTVGGVGFRAVSPCVRCRVTTTDQQTGELRGPEPLATLSTFRATPDGPQFGTNCIPEGTGTIRVGDAVIWR